MQESSPDLHKYVYSEEMVALVSAANEASTFLEGLKDVKARTFIEVSVIHLATVYRAMLEVGETEPVYDSSSEPHVSEQDWAELFQRIAAMLGRHNEILRPAEEGEFDRSDLVSHSISEDLADVYQELRDFTSIYGRGMEELMNDAAWDLQERFADHWGKKLLRALSALHDLNVKGIDPEEEENV